MEEKSLIEEYVRSPVQPLITVALTGTTCYMAIIGLIPPEAFLPLVFLALNWWSERRKEQHIEEAKVKLAVVEGEAAKAK